jgi:hypothetical protein
LQARAGLRRNNTTPNVDDKLTWMTREMGG